MTNKHFPFPFGDKTPFGDDVFEFFYFLKKKLKRQTMTNKHFPFGDDPEDLPPLGEKIPSEEKTSFGGLGIPSVPSRADAERLKKEKEERQRRKIRGDDDERERDFDDSDEESDDEERWERDGDSDDEERWERDEQRKRKRKKNKKKAYQEILWLQIFDRLHEHRMIFLTDEITYEVANTICGLLVYLSKTDPNKDIYLFINSPGGKIIPALAIYDTMQSLPADVHTICFGQASSTASLILAGGEPNKRLAFPSARIRLQKFNTKVSPITVNGRAKDCVQQATEIMALHKKMVDLYEHRTGKLPEVIWRDMSKSLSMSAEEAKSYGIVDHIIATKDSFQGPKYY